MNDLVDSPAARIWESPTTKLTKLIAAPAVEFCKDTDVLLKFKVKVAAKAYLETIEEWADEYIQASRKKKAPVVKAVRSLLKKRGCRFLINPDLTNPHHFVQVTDKTMIRDKIVISLRSVQRRRREESQGKRKRREDASPNDDDAKICKGKRKKRKEASPNDDDAEIFKGMAAVLVPQSPELTGILVPGPPQSLTSSDTLAWIEYYIEREFAPEPSKDTVSMLQSPPEPTGNLAPEPPQGLTSSDTVAWMHQYLEIDPTPTPSKDEVHDDDAKSCKEKDAASKPQSPPEPTVNEVLGPLQGLTSSDTVAWMHQYWEKDSAPAPSKDTVHVSPETLQQELFTSEPLLFATATTTPAAKMMPTKTLTKLPVHGETTARQQLFKDPPQDLQSDRMFAATVTATATAMATMTTPTTMAYNNYTSDDNNRNSERSQGVADTTTDPASPRFSATQRVVATADEKMPDSHPQLQPEQHQQPQQQEQHKHDGGGMANSDAHAHANVHSGIDPELQVYLDRMQHLEERVLLLREKNHSLLHRIVSIEKQTYW